MARTERALVAAAAVLVVATLHWFAWFALTPVPDVPLPHHESGAASIEIAETASASEPTGSVAAIVAPQPVKPTAKPLARYCFDGSLDKATGSARAAVVPHAQFADGALFHDGVYRCEITEDLRAPGLSFDRFTIRLDFCPIEFWKEIYRVSRAAPNVRIPDDNSLILLPSPYFRLHIL